MHAAKSGKAALCGALLRAGARVNVQAARSAQTALHLAAFEGHADVARALLAAGADADLLNQWQETPRALARSRAAGGSARHAAVHALLQAQLQAPPEAEP